MTPPAGVSDHLIPTKTSSMSHSLRMSLQGGPGPGLADGPQSHGLDGAHPLLREGDRRKHVLSSSIMPASQWGHIFQEI